MYFDFLLFAIFAAATWAVASGGLWDAALMVFNVTFAGLVAMNFWEPLADWLRKAAPPAGGLRRWYRRLGALHGRAARHPHRCRVRIPRRDPLSGHAVLRRPMAVRRLDRGPGRGLRRHGVAGAPA